MDVRQEVEFFDRFEAEHGDYDVLSEGGYRRFLTVFRELVAPKAGETGIDLGCGSGAFTRRLAKATGLAMTGMDISPRLVERAKQVSGGERYLVGDITETKLPEASFDVIVYSGVLHHCDERDLRIRILKEGRRLLKPGGRMFAYDPSWHSPSMWLYRDPASPIHSKLGKTDNEVLFKRDELAAEIAEAGFEDVRIRGVAGTTFRYVESFLARMILPLYNLYEILLRFSPLENRWGTFLISYARKGS